MSHVHLPSGCVHRERRLDRFGPMHKVRKTWKSPFQKAIDPDPEFEWLHEIADAQVPELRKRFLAAIQAIRGTVKEAELRDALESGDMERIMTVLGLDGDIAQISGAITPTFTATLHQAGAAALDATPALASLGGSLSMRFDMVNPGTVQAARNHGFNLIRQISDDTRNGIRAIVAHAVEFGGHPYEQARQIRNLIGLTESQAAAVSNFRRLLTTGDRDALTRELRDRRFDGTLRQTLGANSQRSLSPDEIDMMTQRYADRMLAARAETIARTETINAARLGTQAAWIQAAENKLLSHNKIRQGWMVTPDDRLCQYCEAVPDMNPGGVALGQPFQTPFGPVGGPTLHPKCRCIVYLMSF